MLLALLIQGDGQRLYSDKNSAIAPRSGPYRAAASASTACRLAPVQVQSPISILQAAAIFLGLMITTMTPRQLQPHTESPKRKMVADDSYAAADERARDARRAGLHAKKDEQPANTARSYAAKQREWKARCTGPRARSTLLFWEADCLGS